MRFGQWSLVMALALSGCATPPARAPVQTAPRVRPTHRDQPACTAESLQRFVPSVGSVISRKPIVRRLEIAREIAREEIVCGSLSASACLDYGEARAKAMSHAKMRGSAQFRLLDLGSEIALRVDGAEQAPVVYATEAAFVRAVRELESKGHDVALASLGQALRHDFSHVDLVYREREPELRSVPAMELVLSVPLAPRALWEAARIVQDEFARGNIALDASDPQLTQLLLDHAIVGPAPTAVRDRYLEQAKNDLFAVLGLVMLLEAIPDANAPAKDAPSTPVTFLLHCRE